MPPNSERRGVYVYSSERKLNILTIKYLNLGSLKPYYHSHRKLGIYPLRRLIQTHSHMVGTSEVKVPY